MASFILYASLRNAWPLIQQYLRDPAAPFAIRLKRPNSFHAVFNHWHEDVTKNTKYNSCCYKYFLWTKSYYCDGRLHRTDYGISQPSARRCGQVLVRQYLLCAAITTEAQAGQQQSPGGGSQKPIVRLVICDYAQNRTNKL